MGTIVHEDGSEKEETINEAVNLLQVRLFFHTFFLINDNIRDYIVPKSSLIDLKLVSGGPRPFHGLRLNGGKKQQILRVFQDEDTHITIIFGKYVS